MPVAIAAAKDHAFWRGAQPGGNAARAPCGRCRANKTIVLRIGREFGFQSGGVRIMTAHQHEISGMPLGRSRPFSVFKKAALFAGGKEPGLRANFFAPIKLVNA